MKLRILTSLMLVMFLSVGSATVASAHEGCHDDHYCGSWGHGWGWGWGHHWGGCGNDYIYGPDGLYAHCRDSHKSCCDKKESVDAAEHKCADKCEKSDYCGPRYERAYYHEYGCGWGGHLHSACEEEHHGSCCDKKKDSKNDD